MNIAELLAELEEDQKWREDEIRFFQNRGSQIILEREQEQFRRALILFLYAHFEGFCRFTFTLYVNTINKEKIMCSEANYAVAAASLADLFRALRDPQRKSQEFRRTLPDEEKLHRFARDREFLERTDEFTKRNVIIPDHVVDTESNLTPIVLQKNLYRLGLPYMQFDDLRGQISQLLNYRNRIAHGEARIGVNQRTYEALRDTTFKIMNEIKHEIIRALQNKHYLRGAMT